MRSGKGLERTMNRCISRATRDARKPLVGSRPLRACLVSITCTCRLYWAYPSNFGTVTRDSMSKGPSRRVGQTHSEYNGDLGCQTVAREGFAVMIVHVCEVLSCGAGQAVPFATIRNALTRCVLPHSPGVEALWEWPYRNYVPPGLGHRRSERHASRTYG